MFANTFLKIRPMKPLEIDFAIKLAAAEGWNPGLNDGPIFFRTDPNGFFVAEYNDELIGCISAVKYSQEFGFIGLYIVKPEFRGNGIGMQLWNKAICYLDGTNIGLDGVVEQQNNYQKSGFSFAYNNIRFQYRHNKRFTTSKSVRKVQSTDLNMVIEFDHVYFPANRSAFLSFWLFQNDVQAYLINQKNKITGLIVIRKCINGYKIGPLYAADINMANALFQSALTKLPSDSVVYLDIPEPNANANQLTSHYHMEKVFETARMYTRYTPNITLQNIYGVTTFELG